jgi:hypothetical protein
MTLKKRIRTLIYKRTHSGDPDPKTGVFGNNNCMKQVRGWSFDAVIGVGGIGRESQKNCIARKLTWIGIGSHRSIDQRCPLVTFDHFLYYGEHGPLLEVLAPNLAKHIYDGKVRMMIDSLSNEEHLEVETILNLAMHSPSSGRLAGVSQRNFKETICKRKSKSCHE